MQWVTFATAALTNWFNRHKHAWDDSSAQLSRRFAYEHDWGRMARRDTRNRLFKGTAVHLSSRRHLLPVWGLRTGATSTAEELHASSARNRCGVTTHTEKHAKRVPVSHIVSTETIEERHFPLSLLSCFYCRWHACNILCESVCVFGREREYARLFTTTTTAAAPVQSRSWTSLGFAQYGVICSLDSCDCAYLERNTTEEMPYLRPPEPHVPLVLGKEQKETND